MVVNDNKYIVSMSKNIWINFWMNKYLIIIYSFLFYCIPWLRWIHYVVNSNHSVHITQNTK